MTTTPAMPTTEVDVLTTVLPGHADSAVIGGVIFLVLLTLAVLGFVLYRYMCQNRGDYRTTGELAPGEDLDQAVYEREQEDKKEYFI